ncbi:MAG: ABC transporter permease [Anaerolineae bacterium]|nr:ABC transporter permease [Anaerolineae bacterium]MDW8069926.1 FtsX-like permease family protein [Anaerolineae bacterium]
MYIPLSSFAALALRNMRDRPIRTLLTTLGIVLGVAVVLAVSITNHSTLISIRHIFDQAAGHADLMVTSNGVIGEPFADEALARVRRLPEVQLALPVVSGRVLLASEADRWGLDVSVGGTHTANDLLLFGVDPARDRMVRDYDLVAGSFLPAEDDAYSVLLVRDYADEKKLSLGKDITILSAAGQEKLRIVGLIAKAGPGLQNNGAVAIVPFKTAQTLLEIDGELTQIDILANPDIAVSPRKLEALRQALASTLGRGYQVLYPAARGQIVARMLASYQTGLSFFSAVALFVGAFLIYNTFTMTVVERTRAIGMLRLLGATRGQITMLVLIEAAVLGIWGSIAGVGFGILLARGLSHSVAAVTVVEISALHIPPDGLVWSLLVGLGVTLISASLPAWRARNISPLEAFRSYARPTYTPLTRTSWLWGCLLMLVAYLALYRIPFRPEVQVPTGMASVFVLLLGATLVVPVAIGPAERFLCPAMRVLYGNAGQLGVANIRRAWTRTALTVGTLMVGIAMIIGIQTMTNSFERDITHWVQTAIGGDLYVRSPMPMREEFGTRLLSDPAVAEISPITYRQVRLARRENPSNQPDAVLFVGIDPQTYGRVASFVFEDTRYDTTQALTELAMGERLLISATMADRYGLKVGDTLALETRRGVVPFQVIGVVVDFSSQGYVVNGSRADLARYYGENTVDQFIVNLKPGYDPRVEAKRLEDRYGRSRHIAIETAAEFRAKVTRLAGQAFALFDVLGLTGVVIAALGVVNTLLMNVFERQREIGGLRSLGMTRGQVARMILAESGAMGIIGGLFGMFFGLFLARVFLLGVQEIGGYTVSYHLPPHALLIGWTIALVVSQLAALYPAHKAARVRIVEAIQHE